MSSCSVAHVHHHHHHHHHHHIIILNNNNNNNHNNNNRYSSKPEAGAASATPTASTRTRTSTNNKMAAAEDFVHLYVDELRWLRIFLTYVLREGGRAGPTVADTLLELLLREWAQAGEGESSGGGSIGGGGGVDGGGLAAKKQRENEVMALLDNPRAGYDADHALVLVQMLNFKPGQLYLYEKVRCLGRLQDVFGWGRGRKGGGARCAGCGQLSSLLLMMVMVMVMVRMAIV